MDIRKFCNLVNDLMSSLYKLNTDRIYVCFKKTETNGEIIIYQNIGEITLYYNTFKNPIRPPVFSFQYKKLHNHPGTFKPDEKKYKVFVKYLKQDFLISPKDIIAEINSQVIKEL